jgi:iron(III) transport system permease protein
MSVKSRSAQLVNSSKNWIDSQDTLAKKLLGGTIALILIILVGIPIIYYVWGSFWSTPPGLGGTFSLSGYKQLFRQVVYDTALNTILFTGVATLTALTFGIGGAFVTLKTNMPGRQIVPYILIANYVLPSFVVAIAFEITANPTIGVVNNLLVSTPLFSAPLLNTHTIWSMGLISGIHFSGFVYLLVSGAISTIPRSLEESAALSGASNWVIIRRINLPLVLPVLTIAGVLLVSRFFQSFGIPLILGFPSQIFVLATFMYRALTTIPPDFAFGTAIGMVIFVVAILGLILQRSTKGQSEKYEVLSGSTSGDPYKFNLGRLRYPLTVGFNTVMLALFIAPIIALILVSFQRGFASPGPTQWTLQHYETLFAQYQNRVVGSLIRSLIVSIIGAAVGMTLASIASYYATRADSYLGAFLDFLTLSPAAIPAIVVATAFLWITLSLQALGLYGTLWVIILALTAKFIVYATRSTNSSFQAIDPSMEEAAELSGASFTVILRKIYFPMIKPGFFAGFMLLFITYMKVFTIPLLLGAQGNSLYTVVIWNLWNTALLGPAIAMSTILVVIVLGIYALVSWLTDVPLTRL